MKIFKQILLILFINFLGELISKGLNLPIPGSILGMIILLICLFAGIVKEAHIAETANFLLDNMPFFFIPAGIGVMVSYQYLKGNLVFSVITIVVSTLLVISVTAIATQWYIKWKKDD